MKKVIKISKEAINGIDSYVFYVDGNQLFNVECSTKTIKGKELYEKIYNVDVDEIVEVKVDQTELSVDDQKSFGNYVVDLFDSINKSMKEQFKTKSNEQEPIDN